jgi:hypothetical protein
MNVTGCREHEKIIETIRSPLLRPRLESKLDYLPEEQHYKLIGWLRTRLGYDEILRRVKDEFGIETSKGAITKFYRLQVIPYMIAERKIKIQGQNQFNAAVRKDPGIYSDDLLDALGELATTLARADDPNAKDVKMYVDSFIRLSALKLTEVNLNYKLRQLAILERREKRAQETLKNSKLTDTEKALRVGEIFEIKK